MEPIAPRRRRARPVPEAPIESLLLRADDLAKGWLVAVIEREPLSAASDILAGEWAREGPRTCAAVLRALGSDDELERMRAHDGQFAGARALDPLRAVVWSALRSAWPQADPDQVWDLAERLAAVIDALREEAPSPVAELRWPDALERAVARARADGTALSLLVAELVDAERVIAVEAREPGQAVLSRFRDAIRDAVGRRRLAVDDADARVWVIAPETGREEALALGSTIAAAVRGAAPWRGAPLGASIGVAVLGEDGGDATGLIDAAEEAMLGAASGGIEITRLEPGRDPR